MCTVATPSRAFEIDEQLLKAGEGQDLHFKKLFRKHLFEHPRCARHRAGV